MEKSSLKSSNIECRFPHSVSRKGELSHRAHAFMSGQFLPVPILVGLHGMEARVAADSLVHWFVCSTGEGVLQRYIGYSPNTKRPNSSPRRLACWGSLVVLK